MLTLTLDHVKKAETIFDDIYKIYQQRVALFNFKLKRSPELVSLKSVKNYSEALKKLAQDDTFCDLWNAFYCVELGGELKEQTLKDRSFIQHCNALLDGSHEIFHFSNPLSTPIGVDDVKLIKVVAEKLVEEITQWKYQALAMTKTDFWKFDFCVAEIRCVIEKCQAVLDLNTQMASMITLDHQLLIEWWEMIDKNHLTAMNLQQEHRASLH